MCLALMHASKTLNPAPSTPRPPCRSSLLCYVFGPNNSGKSTLVKALAGRRPEELLMGVRSGSSLVAVGSVMTGVGERTLVMVVVGGWGGGLAWGEGGGAALLS